MFLENAKASGSIEVICGSMFSGKTEELIRRIIEYKKFKEMSKVFKENYAIFSNRFYKGQEEIKLPKQKLEKNKIYIYIYQNKEQNVCSLFFYFYVKNIKVNIDIVYIM